MSHNISGYVAKYDDLLRVFGAAAPLPQGLGFFPDDYSNCRLPKLDAILAKIDQLALVRTDFFGGAGTQDAKLWQSGKLVYDVEESHGNPINAVLAKMGVKCVWPGGKTTRQYIDGDGKPVPAPAPDEFDAVDFGHYRDNEDFPVQEISDADRLARQSVWNAAQKKRDPETARQGEYIKLLVQWQDVSGIPVVAHPPGTVFKVL